MYVGRIVAIAKSNSNCLVAMYRISSRSFPNREIRLSSDCASVVPKPGFESDLTRNPFIAYNCLRIVNEYAVVGNGTHVDPIARMLDAGTPMPQAIQAVLESMGHESDDYKTPRIVAVADRNNRVGTFGVVRHDGLFVKTRDLKAGVAFYVATYGHSYPGEEFCDMQFQANNAEESCEYVIRSGIFASLEHPIAAVSAYEADDSYQLATRVAVAAR